MATWQIVSSIIVGLISLFLLVYSFFASKEKGPILSNTFLLATVDERKKMDKSAEYHLVSVVFGVLGIIFLLLTIHILTSWFWIYYIIGILVVALIFYVIKEAIKSETNKVNG